MAQQENAPNKPVHLMYLVEFENRLLVLTEWVYNYITRNRGARLITGKNP